MSSDKAPRQHATEIAALPTKEQRNRALAKVPKHLQALVKTHVKIYFMRRKAAQ